MKLLILLFVFSVFIHILSGQITRQYHINLGIDSKKVVTNPLNDAIPLYAVDSENHLVVGYLKSGDSLPFSYKGETGNWKYVRFENKVVVIHDKGAALSYEIERRWYVSSRWLDVIYLWTLLSSGLLFLLIVFLLKSSKRKTTHNESNQYLAEAYYYKEQSDLKETENSELKRIIKLQQKTYLEKEKQLSESMKQEMNRLHLELRRTAKRESEARYQASVDEMKTSYDRLLKKYQRVVDEAKDFGVDFNDKNYQRLLTGRRYEICVAANLVNEGQYKILEWTPDKGFESNIKVEANENPDLIVESPEGEVLAIECKYRSDFYYRRQKNVKEISWAKLYQMIRYINFSKNKPMPVWVALGLGGESRSPNYHYLVPIEKMSGYSRKEDPDEKGIQVIIKQQDIFNDFVKKGQYAQYLLKAAMLSK